MTLLHEWPASGVLCKEHGGPGVYAIVCSNGRQYVGSSTTIVKRLQTHRRVLRQGKHPNRHLQRAWDKYGIGAFQFRVLARCPKDQVRAAEQQVFDQADWDTLFNFAKDAHRGAGRWGRLGKTNSPEHNAKIGASNRGRPSPRKGKTHDWGRKIGDAQLDHHPDVRASHLDGRVQVYRSVRLAAEGTGHKRKVVSNILNGWASRTRSGWTFEKIARR